MDVAANNKNDTKMEKKRHNVEGKKNFITQAMKFLLSGKFLDRLFYIKTYLNTAFMFSVFYILAYRIDDIRHIFKAISIYCLDYFSLYNILTIEKMNKFALRIESGLIVYLIIYMIYRLILYIIKCINDKNVEKIFTINDGENTSESASAKDNISNNTKTDVISNIKDIDRAIFEYINSDYEHTMLITGEWASGKTYYVKDFFNRYYRYTNKKIYNISCFGLNTRDALASEISHIMKKQDDSLYSQLTSLVANIPIIGGTINNFMSKSYSYENLNKKSIIIFDDFERVAIDMELILGNSFIERGRNDQSKALYEICNAIKNANVNSIYNKYTAIIGMINNLIEVYGIKVIIICNTDFINRTFVKEILKDKLMCHEYHVEIKPVSYAGIVKNIKDGIIFENKKKEAILNSYLTELINNINKKASAKEVVHQFYNLRKFSAFIEAFVETIKIINVEHLKDPIFMDSLFNSVMIAHIAEEKKNEDVYKHFIMGANLIFNIKMIVTKDICDLRLERLRGKEKILLYVSNDQVDNNMLRWVGREISYRWIRNLYIDEKDINSCLSKFDKYKYNDFEKKLSCCVYDSFDLNKKYTDIEFYHSLCLINYFIKKGYDIETNISCYINMIVLKENDTETAQKIIEYMEYFWNRKEFIVDEIFNHIYTKGIFYVQETCYMAMEYNNFVSTPER